jgi:hypothetical protein
MAATTNRRTMGRIADAHDFAFLGAGGAASGAGTGAAWGWLPGFVCSSAIGYWTVDLVGKLSGLREEASRAGIPATGTARLGKLPRF